jgi:hypothetical protein
MAAGVLEPCTPGSTVAGDKHQLCESIQFEEIEMKTIWFVNED